MKTKSLKINNILKIENLKGIHWIGSVIISTILFLKKYIKNRLTKPEKELLKKIKECDSQKIVFIKFDNTNPFSKEIDINHNDENLISLANKGALMKTEQGNSIIYTIS
jgi:hypothetical protein